MLRLKQTLHRYVLSLGIDFRSDAYFEERRQIGIVHQSLGIRQSHYQCAFRRLQDLLITNIPESLRGDDQAHAAMLRFILKITALDISLAVESYCTARLSELRGTRPVSAYPQESGEQPAVPHRDRIGTEQLLYAQSRRIWPEANGPELPSRQLPRDRVRFLCNRA